MAFIEYAVTELAEPLKIEDSVIAYAERQMGPQRNQRYMQSIERVRLGLQTSPRTSSTTRPPSLARLTSI